MEDLTKEQVLDLVDVTLSWGDEVSDLWTGTLYEKQIDMSKEQIEKSVKKDDIEKVRSLVLDLAQFLNEAEREYERAN